MHGTLTHGTSMRALPSVQRLLEDAAAGGMLREHGRSALTTALRVVLEEARTALRRDGAALPDGAELLKRADHRLAKAARPVLRRVINASGIILHTNLGRAPLAAAALAAVMDAAAGYSNLEYELAEGRRGSRLQGVEPLLCAATGAAAAVAVNNNAAAVLLALSALAGGGEVIVSRGELVEIGGGFRIPDVIRQGGARLVEVGTTNRTRLADYRDAITPATRMLLKIHASNYRILGFTAEVGLGELAGLARAHGLLLMADLGSGALHELGRGEPTVGQGLRAGADLIAFSGDKLLGGPQAGLLVGSAAAIDPLRRHPLMRAVRLDKLTLAALEATLRLHENPDRHADIPVLRMLAQDEAVVQQRADHLAALLGGGEVVASIGFAGGGALPGEAIPSRAVALSPVSAEALAERLRLGRPAVLGRLEKGRLLLDLLAVADDELADLAAAVGAATA